MNAALKLGETAVATAGLAMRAVVFREYGTPEVLSVEEVPRPFPGDEEVLVRVHAAAASIADHHVVTGKPYLIRLTAYGGVPRPKNPVPGQAVAGRVEAVGAKVTAFKAGDEVFGEATRGAFAEYAVVKAKLLALKPVNASFEQAAAMPWATAALQGLRDAGSLKSGERVLIHGASGGVGTWAVQIAKALGAHVTAVCSTRNVALVRSLGADEVIDYTQADFTAGGAQFDVMLDLVGDRSLSACRGVLNVGGRYVACAGGGGDWAGPIFRLIGGLVSFMFSGRAFKTFLSICRPEDLLALKALVEAGKARPVIERSFALGETGAALTHLGQGRTRGQVVIQIRNENGSAR